MPALSVRAHVLQEPALIGRSRVSSQLFRHGPIERNLGLGVTDGTSESRPHSGNLYPNMGRTLFDCSWWASLESHPSVRPESRP